MQHRTVMGVFDPAVDTGLLLQELKERGFHRNDILVFGGAHDPEPGEAAEPDQLTTLFRNRGVPDVDADHFADGVRHGDVVVSIQTATEEAADEAAEILDRHGAVDIEERLAGRQVERDSEHEEHASALSASMLDRARGRRHQSGRTRGSKVFVW